MSLILEEESFSLRSAGFSKPSQENAISGLHDFELICFLVVKEGAV